jgi:hypothetical protein
MVSNSPPRSALPRRIRNRLDLRVISTDQESFSVTQISLRTCACWREVRFVQRKVARIFHYSIWDLSLSAGKTTNNKTFGKGGVLASEPSHMRESKKHFIDMCIALIYFTEVIWSCNAQGSSLAFYPFVDLLHYFKECAAQPRPLKKRSPIQLSRPLQVSIFLLNY